MTWVVWRQYRVQAAIAAAPLAVLAALLITSGLGMATQWHNALASCGTAGDCGNLADNLSLGTGPIGTLVLLTMVIPLLCGMFWGSPLVAGEIETGTIAFAWQQSITRRRWLTVKCGWILLAAVIWGGAVSALVTWWYRPVNALYQDRFYPGKFDIQGVVPVGYALFAVALGIAAGTLIRRSLPALAVTMGAFAGLRLAVTFWLRQHYLTPVTAYYYLGQRFTPTGAYWTLSQGAVIHGAGPSRFEIDGVPSSALPASCQALIQRGALLQDKGAAIGCIRAAHIRAYLTYQPASRFWAFQWIETGIFVALAAALIAITFIAASRRDA